MKAVLIISLGASLLFSCNQTRNDGTNTDAFDIITEKSYVVREPQPVKDTLTGTDSILLRRQTLTDYLERHGFKKHVAAKDSLLFRRNNRQEVMIGLFEPEDAWQENMIIAFDPMKNPLFINLRKDTTQIEQYINKK